MVVASRSWRVSSRRLDAQSRNVPDHGLAWGLKGRAAGLQNPCTGCRFRDCVFVPGFSLSLRARVRGRLAEGTESEQAVPRNRLVSRLLSSVLTTGGCRHRKVLLRGDAGDSAIGQLGYALLWA